MTTKTTTDSAKLLREALAGLDSLREIVEKLDAVKNGDMVNTTTANRTNPGTELTGAVFARFMASTTGEWNRITAGPVGPADDPDHVVPVVGLPRGVSYTIDNVYARHKNGAPVLYVSGDVFRAGTRYPFVVSHRIAAVSGSAYEQYPRGMSRNAAGILGEYHDLSDGARKNVRDHIETHVIGTFSPEMVTAGTLDAAANECAAELVLGTHKAHRALADAITTAARVAAAALTDAGVR